MVPVISVACRQFKMKNTLFSCALARKCVCRGFNLQTCFTIYLWLTKLLSIRLELFIYPKLVLMVSSIFSRNKLMIPIVLFQSLWMFFWWLVFTNNLISQTTWLKVKLKLVNLSPGLDWWERGATSPKAGLWEYLVICILSEWSFQISWDPTWAHLHPEDKLQVAVSKSKYKDNQCEKMQQIYELAVHKGNRLVSTLFSQKCEVWLLESKANEGKVTRLYSWTA